MILSHSFVFKRAQDRLRVEASLRPRVVARAFSTRDAQTRKRVDALAR
jgi:hypothetical protein